MSIFAWHLAGTEGESEDSGHFMRLRGEYVPWPARNESKFSVGFLLPLLILLVPLVITPGLLFHYDSVPKIAVLAIGAAVAIWLSRHLKDELSALWRSDLGKWLCRLAILQVGWMAVASAVSVRPEFSIFGSGWRRFGLLTVLALAVLTLAAGAYLLRERKSIERILIATSISAIGVSLYTVAQYFGLDPLQTGAGYRAQDGDFTIVRPPSTLGHADYLGWWLAIALFCAIGLWRADRRGARIIARTAAVLSVIAIVLSGTRSAIVAAVVGALFLATTGVFKPRARHYGIFAGALVLAVVFYVSPAGKLLQARVKWSSDEAPGGARPLLWRDSLKMAANRPLTGFGPETFAAEFPRFQSEELSRLVPDFYHESPHNAALDALTGEGIPGLAITLGWFLLGALAIVRADKSDPVDTALAAGLVASFVASLFNSITVAPALATLVLLAALVARRSVVVRTGARRIPARLQMAAAVPIAGALCGFALLLLLSDYKLERFRRSTGENNARAAVTAYESLWQPILKGAGDDLYCSRRLAATCASGVSPIDRLACSQVATQAAAHATQTADNPPNAWYNLAMFAAAHNDARGAEQALRTTIDLAPNWFRPHWALANYLKLSGRTTEAQVHLEKAAYLSAGKVTQVNDSLRPIAQAR